jgi:hypothetical protein
VRPGIIGTSGTEATSGTSGTKYRIIGTSGTRETAGTMAEIKKTNRIWKQDWPAVTRRCATRNNTEGCSKNL